MITLDGLIATLTIGLVSAFVGGFIATRLRLPALVGYLLAGVAVGPFTPGFVANVEVAHELAKIGVILLMFGIGIHFSPRDLLVVRRVALPGAITQTAITAALGTTIALSWGWNLGAGLVLGMAISVASTVVLLRALMERDAFSSEHGRAAVGWLVVEDVFTVLILMLLPELALVLGAKGNQSLTGVVPVVVTLFIGVVKIGLLAAGVLFIGSRVVPWLLAQVAYTGSRELFTLAALALAIGVAFASAALFGASLALGAFLAGVVMSESDLSHRTATEVLPLRDAFAVLFFVSVGMLFDPWYLLASPGNLLAILAVIILGKGLVALAAVSILGYPLRTGLTVAAGLAQIGEFSFILAEFGRRLGLLPEEGYSLILAAALVSIAINPLVSRTIEPIERWVRQRPRLLCRSGAARQSVQ